jgi:DNA-binding MarR family transcriptional regulator
MDEYAFLLIELPATDKFGAVALAKQLKQYRDKTGMEAAFLMGRLTKAQRDALIGRKIPFVSLPDQAYLPFLGMVLRNSFKKAADVSNGKMMPATQSLFLYILYHKDSRYIVKKQAAEDLSLTRTSITRSSKQLKQMGLIEEEQQGKEIRMIPLASGRDLYERAKDFLINPVQKRLYINENRMKSDLFLSGESLLSRHSMLGSPRYETYAAYKGSVEMESLELIDPLWQPDRGSMVLELWKYDPALFAVKGEVDPVSLAMSLSESEDERVQGELEEYLEGYEW